MCGAVCVLGVLLLIVERKEEAGGGVERGEAACQQIHTQRAWRMKLTQEPIGSMDNIQESKKPNDLDDEIKVAGLDALVPTELHDI